MVWVTFPLYAVGILCISLALALRFNLSDAAECISMISDEVKKLKNEATTS